MSLKDKKIIMYPREFLEDVLDNYILLDNGKHYIWNNKVR
jgi:hypothetical protein